MQTVVLTARGKFMFSNPLAQAAEARLNAAEAQKLLARWVPEHLRETNPEEPTSAAGTCFRKVAAILAGKPGSKAGK